MKPETRALLDKARRSVDAARELLASGHADFAESRGYYGAFYAAEAFLLERGLSFSRHSAVIAEFGRRAVKEEGLSADLHRLLIEAFEHRNVADYMMGAVVDSAEAAQMIERVEDFIKVVAGHLTD